MSPNVKKQEEQSSSMQQQQHSSSTLAAAPAAKNAFSRIAAPADRSTSSVVGLLPEAAQLGCLRGLETAQIEDRYSSSSTKKK